MNFVSIVGARPQFIKAAALSRLLRKKHREILIHTGQHYDDNMSSIFFAELGIPTPDFNLGVGSASHGAQTAAMLSGIEEILLAHKPDWVLVFGDTNSTLAGALAATKLNIPIAHFEAGLRSFNRSMPEEINRILTDRMSSLLFCPSQTAVDNLAAEGITTGVHLVGDLMADALAFARERARHESRILQSLGLTERGYLLITVHRQENTEVPARLESILRALNALDEPCVFPVHPRTRKAIAQLVCKPAPDVRLIEPVGYLDMIRLEMSARLVLTDSGGVQKEAYWLGVPCVTLRDETEWVETVQTGWNILAGADASRIVSAVRTLNPPPQHPSLYGDETAAEQCVAALEVWNPASTGRPSI